MKKATIFGAGSFGTAIAQVLSTNFDEVVLWGRDAALVEVINRTHENANYLRFRLSPSSAVALAARVKRPGKEFIGEQRELYLLEEHPGEETPYERLLGDAIAGDGALFTREDAVEAAWAVIDPVLKTHRVARPYRRGSWGPKEADALIAGAGCWHNPKAEGTGA